MTIKDTVLDLLFPPKCPFCGKVTDGHVVCPACRRTLPWTEGSDTVRHISGVSCAAPLWYEDGARHGVLRYKFQGIAAGADVLGELIAQCAAEQYSGEFDTVTWVPVGKKRLRSRGYDQARLLAEHACRCWDTKPQQLLRKIADNPPQSGLRDAAARRANVLGVYEVCPDVSVEGKHILLVDDIVTTGATLAECAAVLITAGAATVICATLAAARPSKRDGKPQTEQNT